jgi:chorismate mutase
VISPIKDHSMLKPLTALFAALPLISSCTTATSQNTAPAALRPLIEAVGQRTEIANDVALSKWYSGKPVQDSEREQQVILNAENQANSYGLAKDDVRRFMTAQIEANKMVQYARIAQWHGNGQVPARPDASVLQGIRVRLDTLQPVMMQKYAAFMPLSQDKACPGWVQAEIHRHTSDPIIVTAMQKATEGLCSARDRT